MVLARAAVALLWTAATLVVTVVGEQAAAFPKRLPTDSFPCTTQEKACFQHDRLFHSPSNKCYRIGTQGPCPNGEEFVAMKRPYHESGRLVGECRSTHLCDGDERVRLNDGRCYDATPNLLPGWKGCPYNSSQLVKKDIFGEGSCCDPNECLRIPPVVVQPSVEGRCYAPNVEYKSPGDSYPDIKNPMENKRVKCNDKQVSCFYENKVWFQKDGNCYKLLEPCGSRGWVVADKKKFVETATLEPVCAQPRCPPGRVFMAREQQCRSLWELQGTLCSGDDVMFDVFGEAHCGRGTTQSALMTMPGPTITPGECQYYAPVTVVPTVEVTGPTAPTGFAVAGTDGPSKQPCGPNDNNECEREVEVEAEKA